MHIYCVYSPFRSNFSTVKCLVSIGDHGLQEPLSSGLKVLSPADQQVQSCPVSPASAHSSIVDLTTEGEFTAITPNITHTAVNAWQFMPTTIINLLTDNILSWYEIGRKLGEGGFCFVYEGKRLEDGLEVSSFSHNILLHCFGLISAFNALVML